MWQITAPVASKKELKKRQIICIVFYCPATSRPFLSTDVARHGA